LPLSPERSPVTTSRRKAGDAGEEFASGRLQRSGYAILDRNWHCRWGEIDIVALDGDQLVFVEVRVRTGERYSLAEETVGPAKLNRILSSAMRYVETHPEHDDRIWRVDLIAITLTRDRVISAYRHYQNLTLD
jgi:putative endonuclease